MFNMVSNIAVYRQPLGTLFPNTNRLSLKITVLLVHKVSNMFNATTGWSSDGGFFWHYSAIHHMTTRIVFSGASQSCFDLEEFYIKRCHGTRK